MKNLLYLFVIVLLFSSCSGFEKIRKSPDIDFKYSKAMEFYKKGKYKMAADLFDDVVVAMRGSSRADSAYFLQAMSHYNQGGRDSWTYASALFTNFSRNFFSNLSEEADFMNLKCYYYLSPRPSLDQTATYEALKSAQLFLGRYPRSKHYDEAIRMMSELDEKLVQKSFISAKLYFDIGDYKASITALNSSLLEYPESIHREELMFMLLKASYEYANNSVFTKQPERYQATLDEYYAFQSEFPESKLRKDADRIYRVTQAYLSGQPVED